MPEDTIARSNFVHIALRTAAMYPTEARVRRVGGPPAYIDVPGFYEVDPNFPDTEQTSGELALLGIVARLAEQDVTIRQLKQNIELLEDIVEGREMEEIEDLCGTDEGSADEWGDTEELCEEESTVTEEIWEELKEESTEEVLSGTGGGAPSPSTSGILKSGGRSRATRSEAVPLHERGMGNHTVPNDNAGEGSQQGPARWAGRKIERTVGVMALKRKYSVDRTSSPTPSAGNDASSDQAECSTSFPESSRTGSKRSRSVEGEN